MSRSTQNVITIDPGEVASKGAAPIEYTVLRRLWSAVLYESILDYWWGKKRELPEPPASAKMPPLKKVKDGQHCGTRYEKTSVYNYEQACIWLRSNDIRPRGFLWVCSNLGLDPDMIRRKIQQPSNYLNAKVVGDKVQKAEYLHGPRPGGHGSEIPNARVAKRLAKFGSERFDLANAMQVLNLIAASASDQIDRWLERGFIEPAGDEIINGKLQSYYQVKKGILDVYSV